MGATVAIGSLKDTAFLTATFSGAEAAYCMMPFNLKEPDQAADPRRISANYVTAIQQAGIKRVVHLSGWAADVLRSETVKDIFDALPGLALPAILPDLSDVAGGPNSHAASGRTGLAFAAGPT